MPKTPPPSEMTDFDGNPLALDPETGEVVNRNTDAAMVPARKAHPNMEAATKVQSYDDVAQLLGAPVAVSEWDLLDKARLEGVPFVVLAWQFNDGTYGEFVSVYAITRDNRKVVFVDGSTGVMAQIREHEAEHGTSPIAATGGLRRSDYTTPAGTPASTYYLA